MPFDKNYPGQTIRDAWQEGVNNGSFNYPQNPHPGYGTHITGDNDSAKGFDYNVSANPSLRVWDAANNNWSNNEPATISTSLANYEAYYFFIRGSRAIDLSKGTSAIADVDATTLRMKGTLNQHGLATFSKSYNGAAGNWIFVGNPYACPLNIATILTSAGLTAGKKFWVWDPKLSSPVWGTVGAYVVYDGTSNTMVPLGGSYSNPTTTIQSCQGFLLQLDNTSTSATLTFREADKSLTESNVFGKEMNRLKSYPTIYTNLLLTDSISSQLTDGVGTVYDNSFSDDIDDKDALKLWGFGENIALARNGKTLSIELRSVPSLSDTIFYKLYTRQLSYTLQIFSRNLPSAVPVKAWLVDKYLDTNIEVNLLDTLSYSFVSNTDVNSYEDRFMLVLQRRQNNTPFAIIPVRNDVDDRIKMQ